MKNSELLETISRVLYPFILLFGLYIILNGDLSPGGGFQGGTILATAFLTIYLVKSKNTISVKSLLKLEKVLFLMLLFVAVISVFTRGVPFTNFLPLNTQPDIKRVFLIILNILFGLKVATGLIAVFTAFISENEDFDDTY